MKDLLNDVFPAPLSVYAPSPSNRVVITLSDQQTSLADDVARKRQGSAERRRRRGGNKAATKGAASLKLHIEGCRGELAGKLYLDPVEWHDFRESIHGIPDYEDWIDAKTISKPWHRMPIQKDDPSDWAYLLIIADHPDYVIAGWIWGHEGKQEKFWSDPVGGRGAFFVRQEILRPPASLIEELNARRGSL